MRLNAGVTALLLCLVGTTAEAQITWSGTGATANWGTAGNWGPATPPANGFNSALVFAGSNLLSNTNTLTGGTATSITFNSGAGAFVIGGNAITLGGAITNNSTSLQTINLDLTSAATRTLTLTAGGGNLALGGKLSGNGGYTLGGTGTVTISGAANDYAGNTTFAANQTLNINSNQALGNGALVADGNGSFNNTSGSPVSIANNFNLSNGSPTFIGTGNLAMTGTATISGANRTLTVSGGTLTLGRIDADTTSRTFTKAGAGTLAITGSAGPNFQGAFIYSAGSLILGHKNALGSGEFRITGGSSPGIQATTDLSGANAIPNVVSGSANATVSGANNITFSGAWTNGGGDRTLTSSLDAGKTLTLGNVFLSESTATGRLFTIAGTGNTTVGGVIANANGSGQPGRVTITNTGLTVFSGANTYTGTTTVSTNAVVRAADGMGIPTSSPLTLSGGNLETSGTFNRSIGTAAGQVSLAGNWGFNASGANLTVDFNADGAGGTPINWVDTWGFNSPTFVRGTSGSNTVKWIDNLNLQAATTAQTRTVNVGYNALSKSAYLEMSGTYSDLGGVDSSTRLAKGGDGLLVLSGTVASTVELLRFTDGVMRAVAGSNFSLTAQGVEFNTTTAFSSTIASGVLESSGTFNQTVGTSSIPGATRFIGSAGGGWSAFGAKLTVDLNTLNTRDNLTWGTGGFVPNGGVLRFGSQWSDNLVEFRDNIALSGSIRDIGVVDNADSSADYAEISGVLSGDASSGIRKLGTGILRLSGANTFAGGATITEGTLLVGVSDNGSTSGALGTAAAVVGGTSGSAAAAILVDGTFTLSRNITVQAGSTGAATLGGANTSGTANVTGNVTLNRSVTLQAAAGGTVAFGTGSWTTNDNAVTIGSAGNTGSVRIASTLSSTSGVTVAFGTLVVPSGGGLGSGNPLAVNSGALASVDYAGPALGAVTNSGSLAFGSTSGTATLAALSGSGTTAFSSDAAITSLSGNAISIASGKVLAASGGAFGGSISGSGGLTKLTSGTLTLSAANTYTGQTRVSAGVLALGAADAIANQSNLFVDGGTFDLATFNDAVGAVTITSGTLSGSGTLTGSSYALQGGSVAATLGTGAITASSGTTTLVGAGRLNAASPLTMQSGQLTLGGNESVAGFTLSGGVLGGVGATLTSGSAYDVRAGTVLANLGGSVGLVKSTTGLATLSGANGYGGTTTISAGTLALGAGGSFASSPTITVGGTGSSGAVLDLTAKTSGFSFGTGQTVKGIGTIRMSSGQAVTISGTLAPGNSPGTLTIANGDLVLAAGSVTQYEINGTNATPGGGTNDLTSVSNGLTLGGTLNVSATPAFDLFGSRTWRVFDYATSGSGSLAGSMAIGTTPDANYLYSLDTATLGQVNLFVQRRAEQSATLAFAQPTSGTVSAFASTNVAFSGTLTNLSPSGGAALVVSLSGTGGQLAVGGLAASTGATVAAGSSATVTGQIATGTVLGTRTWSVVNTDTNAIGSTTASATGAVNVFAHGTPTLSGSAIDFGYVLVGSSTSRSLTVSNGILGSPQANTAAITWTSGSLPGGFTGGGANSAGLVASGSGISYAYALYTGYAGYASGLQTFSFADDTSILGNGALGSQSVSLAGTVLDPATAILGGGITSGTNWSVNLGEQSQGVGQYTQNFDISNWLQTAGYTADLELLSFTADPGNTGDIGITLNGGSFPTLVAGGTNFYKASLALGTTGTFANIYTLTFGSWKNGSSLGGTPQNVRLSVSGIIVVPEPGSLALAAVGGAAAALAWNRRRRRRGANSCAVAA